MVTKEDEDAFLEWMESIQWPGGKRPKPAPPEDDEDTP